MHPRCVPRWFQRPLDFPRITGAQGEIVRLVAQGIQRSRQAQRDIRGG
jgi:hypothetical protein